MSKSVDGICQLCGKYTQLIESHIIPRSIVQWLKNTSATGFLRSADNPEKRKQDGAKAYLMCASCDGDLIGSYEKKFLERFFRPYKSSKPKFIEYDEYLHYFAASIAFRIIIFEESRIPERKDLDFRDFQKPKEFLKRYLRGLSNKKEGLEHYIIPTDDVAEFTRFSEDDNNFYIQHGLPQGLEFHLARTLDSVAFYLGNNLITFAQLPGLIFITVIKPRRFSGNLGQKIEYIGGRIEIENNALFRNSIYPFLVDRSKRVDMKYMSDQQADKLENFIAVNPDRWNESETKRYIHSLIDREHIIFPEDK